MKQHLWLDCDTGSDDSFAIVLAGHTPSLHLLGISTVFGNNQVAQTTLNTLRITSMSGLQHIKVYKGASKPLLRPAQLEAGIDFHGKEGLVPSVPEPTYTHEKDPAVLSMYQSIVNSPQKVALVATGALTNVALLLQSFPEVASNIEKLIIMGGGKDMGNVTQHAEYNFYSDPEAASIVFHSDLEIAVMPLNLTHSIRCTLEVQSAIKRMDSPFAGCMYEIMMKYAESYKEYYGFECPPLHDPITVAYLLDSSHFEGEYHFMDVEHKCETTFGKLHVSQDKKHQKRKVFLAMKANAETFWAQMLFALNQASEANIKQNQSTTLTI